MLSWPVMQTDVFLDGRSLIDGRTIAEARAAAPVPAGRYERWISDGLTPYRRAGEGRLVPPWAAAAGLASLAWFAVARQPVWTVPSEVAVLVLLVIWARMWVWLLIRVDRYLLTHPALGEGGRLIRFVAVFAGWPVMTFWLPVLVIHIASGSH